MMAARFAVFVLASLVVAASARADHFTLAAPILDIEVDYDDGDELKSVFYDLLPVPEPLGPVVELAGTLGTQNSMDWFVFRIENSNAPNGFLYNLRLQAPTTGMSGVGSANSVCVRCLDPGEPELGSSSVDFGSVRWRAALGGGELVVSMNPGSLTEVSTMSLRLMLDPRANPTGVSTPLRLVPEPSTAVLVGLGLAGLGWWRRRVR
jgi:hypothetical protein